MLTPMYCVMSVDIKEPHVVETSGALHYSVSHNHSVVLGHKTREINQITLCISACIDMLNIQALEKIVYSVLAVANMLQPKVKYVCVTLIKNLQSSFFFFLVYRRRNLCTGV